MKIILSPAKKMNDVDVYFTHKQLPSFIHKTEELKNELCKLSVDEISKIMKCNDKIARLTYERYQNMDLYNSLSPAIFTYEGLAFQHLAANIMSEEELDYLENHLYILSGFYGALKPFDGIRCYRLEMQIKEFDLYNFWNELIANKLYDDNDLVINLASTEYSSCITPYLNENRKMINIVFSEEKNGKLKTKGTEAKMCRGAMVRYMAVNKIKNIEDLKNFEYIGYKYNEVYSNENELVFVKG